MALSLSAEQKNLKSIFMNDYIYIVPPYQRPYSWTQEQCFQLYDDIVSAFKGGDSYFVGNIVLATKVGDERQEIIDGQQRLITLWLFIKVLSILLPALSKIERMLWIDSWEGVGRSCKFISNVIESNNQEELNRILQHTADDFDIAREFSKQKKSRFKRESDLLTANAIAIYNIFDEYFSRIGDNEKKEFWEYFSTKVYLLPITLSDEDMQKATTRALTIFETINNRGIDLQDADIFKASLYDMSLKVNESPLFIRRWQEITSDCDNLGIRVDDLFRYYYQIIRGKEGVITSEKGLRDFFQKDKLSPFSAGDYQNIMDLLCEILEVLKYIADLRGSKGEIAKWLQILYAYTNQYPQFALVVYLYLNKNAEEASCVEFVKKIVRYCYGKGSTTTVKFEMYSIISKVMHGELIGDYYLSELKFEMVDFPGRLTTGLSLLYYYLEDIENVIVSPFTVEKILKAADQKKLSTWDNDCFSSLANYIVLDRALKSSSFESRITDYQESSIPYVQDLFSPNGFSKEDFEERRRKIQQVLAVFFKGDERDRD